MNLYFDDVSLGSLNVEEYCNLLRETLKKARDVNRKFNIEKTQLTQTSVNYLRD